MKKVILLSSLVILAISCKKESEQTTAKLSYLPLNVGNYWIYEEVSIDSNSVVTVLPKIDSVYISKDTTISDKTYYRIENQSNNDIFPINTGYYRDSVGYLVNQQGTILFSQYNFSDILYKKAILEPNNIDTTYTATCKMENGVKEIKVPAGTFNALNYKVEVYLNPKFNLTKWNPRELNNYYSENVGLLIREFTYSASYHIYQKRLIRFKIN